MSWSATEVRALAARAARGAGAYPWQADLFGSAAVQHLLTGAPVTLLEQALAALPQGPILHVGPFLLGLQTRPGSPQPLPGNIHPMLLQSYAASQTCKVAIDHAMATATACINEAHRPANGRIEGYDAFMSALKTLAEKTYVPESDASRSTGAGSGPTDND